MSAQNTISEITFTTEVPELQSPYQLIGTLNKVRTELGVNTKDLPPQMGYTYVRKGMVDGVKGTHKVTKDNAITWYIKYLSTKV